MLGFTRCFLKQDLLSKCEIGTINLFNPKGVLGSNHQSHSIKAFCSCTGTHWGLPWCWQLTAWSALALAWPKSWLKRFRRMPFSRAPATLLTLLQRKDEIGVFKVDHSCTKPSAFPWSPRPSFSTVPACDS